MAGRPECVVATVFTDNPPRGQQRTTYDASCGFDTGRHAMGVRRQEDRAALAVLAATGMHLGFSDHQYTPHVRPPVAELAEALIAAIEAVRPERILAPVGLGHPDHMLVAAAVRHISVPEPVYLYEELPYRVLFPEVVAPALALWGELTGPEFIGTGPEEAKAAAVGCYSSQLWALNQHAVMCPERFWRLP